MEMDTWYWLTLTSLQGHRTVQISLPSGTRKSSRLVIFDADAGNPQETAPG